MAGSTGVRQVRSVVVERERWERGRDEGALCRRRNGKESDTFCFLGFCGLALGVSREEMLDASRLTEVTWDLDGFAFLAANGHTLESKVTHINDDAGIDDEEREEKLAALLGAAGIAVHFVGEGNPYEEEDDEDTLDDDLDLDDGEDCQACGASWEGLHNYCSECGAKQ